MSPTRYLHASILILTTLTGCGGGGSSSAGGGAGAGGVTNLGSQAATNTSVPGIAAVSPADKDSCVASNDTVTITFSNAMNATSVKSAFHVSNSSGAVAGTVTYTNQIATFTPNSPFATNGSYTASIDSTVADAQGNSLGTGYTWTFSTIPPATTKGDYIICWNPVSDSRLTQYHLYWDTNTPVTTAAPHQATVAAVSPATIPPHSYEIAPSSLGAMGSTVYIAVSAENADTTANSVLSDTITVTVQ